MKVNIKTIGSTTSTLINTIKLLLIVEIIFGHFIGLVGPKFSELDLSTTYGLVWAIVKGMFSFGRESAFIFVILSGYLTAPHFFLKSQAPVHDTFKRLNRLYPTLLVGLVLTLFLDFIGIDIFHLDFYNKNGMNYIVEQHRTFGIFLANILSLQPTWSLTFGSNGPIWTLGYLVQFFLFSQLLKPLYLKNKYVFVIVWILSLFLSAIVISVEFSLLFGIWLLGAIVRVMNINSNMKRWFYPAAFLFSMTFILLARFCNESCSVVLCGFAASILLLLFEKCNFRIESMAFKLINRRASDIFYAYVCHMPVAFLSIGLYLNFVNSRPTALDYLYLFLIFSAAVIFVVHLAGLLLSKYSARVGI